MEKDRYASGSDCRSIFQYEIFRSCNASVYFGLASGTSGKTCRKMDDKEVCGKGNLYQAESGGNSLCSFGADGNWCRSCMGNSGDFEPDRKDFYFIFQYKRGSCENFGYLLSEGRNYNWNIGRQQQKVSL